MLLALAVFVAWGYYNKNGSTMNNIPASFESNNSITDTKAQKNYQCDGRQHCSQMGSYEE